MSATISEQWIEVERHRQRGRRSHVQIVGEAAGAGAEHEHSAGRRVAQQRGERVERGVVLGIAPAPVAMDVGVVSRQPLVSAATAFATRDTLS